MTEEERKKSEPQYKINFHNTEIKETRNLKEITFTGEKRCYVKNIPAVTSKQTINITELLNDLRTAETILCQKGNLMHPEGMIAERPYTFDNMLSAQHDLEMLSLIEKLKYAPYYINARQLLYRYLYSRYSYSVQNLLRDIGLTNINGDIPYARDDISLSKYDQMDTPTKSIRHPMEQYLSEMSTSNGNKKYGLFCHGKDNIESRKKARFYLPIYSIPEFLLRFIYFDGRDFSNIRYQKSKDSLPRKAERKPCLTSYKIVLKKIQDLHPSSPDCNPFITYSIYRYDSVFLSQKLNVLSFYQKLYLKEPVLNWIISKYRLSYNQITNLESFLTNNIFKDEDFIKRGLKSPYLDFMLPFDIFFQSLFLSLFPRDLSLGSSLETFQKDIDEIKRNSLLILENVPPYNPCIPSLVLDSNENFNIKENENKIYKRIKENPFYQNYFFSNNHFITSFIEDSNSSETKIVYPKFGDIKEIISRNI